MSPRTTVTFLALLGIAAPVAWGNETQVEAPPTEAQSVEAQSVAAQPASEQQDRVADEQKARDYFTDLPLITQDGEQVRFYTDVLKDRVVLINFVYTNCKDTCPLMTQMLLMVRDRLGELFDNPVHFVSISTDPERDTPQALTEFAKQQKADDPGWVFLTGEKNNIDFILKRLGQYTPQFEAHSTLMLAGNVRTRHWMKIPPMTPVPAIVVRLQTLASES
ncbi:MAG: SCO family protein [Gammaproteobacteria bacterium]|nr:SCO family protein [Gammaproteobacteria bacterium]